MLNSYHYMPISEEDEKWGLCVLNSGCTRIEPSTVYPFKNHPSHHYFDWDNGRVLDEYQVIYITRGSGIFESESYGKGVINEGTIIFLFPGERHRYKPDEDTGWDEHWVGIKGNIVANLAGNQYFDPKQPLLNIGFNENILNIYNDIIKNSKEEKPGYQPLISGAVLHLLGSIHAISKQNNLQKDNADTLVNKAKALFRENIGNDFSAETAAQQLDIGYSSFRKTFKNYTGISPGQYFIQLKIQRAKELLSDPSIAVKEIAYKLKFDSNFYFSKLFKEKTGLTPMQYRAKVWGKLS